MANEFSINFPFKGVEVPLGISIAMRVHKDDGSVYKFAVVSANPQHYDCTVGDVIVAVDDTTILKTNPNPLKALSKLIKEKRDASKDVVLTFRRGVSSLLSTPPPKRSRRQRAAALSEKENDIMTNQNTCQQVATIKVEPPKMIDTSKIDTETKLQIEECKSRYVTIFANELDMIMKNYEERIRKILPNATSNQINSKMQELMSSKKEKNQSLNVAGVSCEKSSELHDSDNKQQETYQTDEADDKTGRSVETRIEDSTYLTSNTTNDGFSLAHLLVLVGGAATLGFYLSKPLKVALSVR